MGRVALFDSVDIVKRKKSSHIPGFSGDVPSSAVYLSPEHKAFSERLESIEQGKAYDFVSFGQWNLQAVVFHLLTFTGAARGFSSTYGLGPTAARAIVKALDDGLLTDFGFVYDHKVRTYKEEAHNLCASRFQVKVTSIHMKATTLINDDWGILITGSANWSDRNAKIELTKIEVDREKALYFENLLKHMAESTAQETKEIYNELNAKGLR